MALSPRCVVLFAERAKFEDVSELYSTYLRNYDGNDEAVLQLCLDTAFRLAVEEKRSDE